VLAVVVCPSCRAKVRATRDRCPRCRGSLGSALPAAGGRDLSRVAPLALGLLIVAGLAAAFGLYRQSAEMNFVEKPATPVEPARSALDRASAAPAPPVAEAAFVGSGTAGSLAYEEGEYERAVALYQDAVKKNPDDAEAWSNLGQVLVRLGRTADAIPNFERAISILPGRWAYHFNLARAYGLLNRWDEAVASYREAERLYPNDYAVSFNLGLALRKTGDHAGAIEEFKKAIALDPQDPTFHLSLATSYEAIGREAEAVEAYRRTLELAPEAPEAPRIRAHIERLVQ
jgi:tetratricopeptide (TPR) repeat protein